MIAGPIEKKITMSNSINCVNNKSEILRIGKNWMVDFIIGRTTYHLMLCHSLNMPC